MKPYQNRVENLVPTPSFDALYLQHLKEFGQSADLSERKSVGSSDVGNVSQVVPTIQPYISIAEAAVAPHSQGMVEASCSSRGLESIRLGAKLLALTALDLLLDPQTLAAIKLEHSAAVANQCAA